MSTYPPEFTVAYLVHGDLDLLDLVVPTSLTALCSQTNRSYDLVLVVDGATTDAAVKIMRRAHERWGVDEVRVRRRERHRAGGDPSNNGHAHLALAKGRFLITLEGDVVAFRTGSGDALAAVAAAFDAAPGMALATGIDDHDCWQ